MDNSDHETLSVPAGDQRAEFADLIAQLEKAIGPDRQLDRMIAVHPSTPQYGIVKNADIERVRLAEEDWDPPLVATPFFTTSIDAALTLVPEDHAADITAYDGGVGDARIWDDSRSNVRGTTHSLHNRPATPAIALCIAALRARAAISKATGAAS